LAGKAIEGAADALEALERRGMPYRIVTNTSLVSRSTLAASSRSLGAPIPAERFHSALSVSAAYTAARFPGQPLYVLGSDDAVAEFTGQRLLSDEEADAPETRAVAVVVGDSPERATWDNLNRAFRLIRRGAELIGMHKNRWWLTEAGPTLDSGAFVAGLEFAGGVKARVMGKPSRAFFNLVARELSAEVAWRDGRGRVRRSDLAMVGDDVWTDALAAQRAGLRGILVLTGKHGPDDLARAAEQRRAGGRPDAVFRSLADVVAALD
jgi:HAD superfamily hydrolase (TIGR01458 family)